MPFVLVYQKRVEIVKLTLPYFIGYNGTSINESEGFMKLLYLLFGCALALSCISAFYAIVGLVAIFAASAVAIAILGTALEVSKLVIASFLYRRWAEINILMRTYFTLALVLLMGLTSMGIYGFLSKSHLDQALQTGDNSLKIELLDSQIKRQQDIIETNETVLSQLDGAVATLTEYDKISGPDGAIAVRKSQTEQRQGHETSINAAAKAIEQLQIRKVALQQEQLTAEVKLGPIKYIGALFGWEDLETAVRIVILVIVFVCDPLAIILLIAANREMIQNPVSVRHLVFPNRRLNPFRKKEGLVYDEGPEEDLIQDEVLPKDEEPPEDHLSDSTLPPNEDESGVKESLPSYPNVRHNPAAAVGPRIK